MSFPVLALLDDFNRANGSLGANWSTLFGSGTTGNIESERYHNQQEGAGGTLPTEGANYWNVAEFNEPSASITTTATGAERTQSIFVCLQGPTTEASGYQLRAVKSGITTEFAKIQIVKFEKGVRSVLAEKANVKYSNPGEDKICLSAQSGKVIAWLKQGSGSWEVIQEAADAKYSKGFSGCGGAGNGVLFDNFESASSIFALINPGVLHSEISQSASYQVNANKTEEYKATGLPEGLSINSVTGLITGSPTRLQNAIPTLTIHNATEADIESTFQWSIEAPVPNPAFGGNRFVPQPPTFHTPISLHQSTPFPSLFAIPPTKKEFFEQKLEATLNFVTSIKAITTFLNVLQAMIQPVTVLATNTVRQLSSILKFVSTERIITIHHISSTLKSISESSRNIYNRTLSSVLNFVGALPSNTKHTLTGSLKFQSGMFTKPIQTLRSALQLASELATAKIHPLKATLQFVSTSNSWMLTTALLSKLQPKSAAGSNTTYQQTASIKPISALSLRARRSLASSLSFASELRYNIAHRLTSKLNLIGSIGHNGLRELSARIGPATSVNKLKTIFPIQARITPSEFKAIVEAFQAALGLVTSQNRNISAFLRARLNPSTELPWFITHPLSALIKLAGRTKEKTILSFQALIKPSVTFREFPLFRNLTAKLSPAGSVVPNSIYRERLKSFLQPIATMPVRTRHGLKASVKPLGALPRSIRNQLEAVLNLTRSLSPAKIITQLLMGSLSFAGSIAPVKLFVQSLRAVLRLFGSIGVNRREPSAEILGQTRIPTLIKLDPESAVISDTRIPTLIAFRVNRSVAQFVISSGEKAPVSATPAIGQKELGKRELRPLGTELTNEVRQRFRLIVKQPPHESS